MPTREIVIKVALEGLTDASTQADSFSGSLKGVGDAAAAATTQAAPLGDAVTTIGTASKTTQTSTDAFFDSLKAAATRATPPVQAVVPPLTAIEIASNTATAAIEKLGNVTGIRGLSMAIAQSQIDMEAFKKAADAAAASGQTVGPQISVALKTMQTDIDAATVKLGTLRKAQADVGAAAAVAGSQLDSLRTRAGSLTSMFDSMEKTGTGLTKTVGQIGLGVGIASMAFVGAEAAGNALGKSLLYLEEQYSALRDRQMKAADSSNLMQNALNAVAQGHIKLGNNIQETIRNYEIYIASSGKAGIATEAFNEALKKIQPPKNLQEATANMDAFAIALQAANAKGIESTAAFMTENKKSLDMVVAGYTNLGQLVPVEFQRIVTAQKQAVAAQKLLSEEGAQAAIESFAKIAAAQKLADDADVKATQRAVTNAEEAMKALNAETVSAEEYSKRKQAIYALETAQLELAFNKQRLATAQAELDQAKLAKTMGDSAFAFQQVADAAGTYGADLAKGIQPSTALFDATDKLRKSIAATGEAIPQLDTGLQKLVQGAMKEGAQGAVEVAKQVAEMDTKMVDATKSVTIFGMALDVLKGKLDGVAASFAAAGVAM